MKVNVTKISAREMGHKIKALTDMTLIQESTIKMYMDRWQDAERRESEALAEVSVLTMDNQDLATRLFNAQAESASKTADMIALIQKLEKYERVLDTLGTWTPQQLAIAYGDTSPLKSAIDAELKKEEI